jgi:hypothetical protein
MAANTLNVTTVTLPNVSGDIGGLIEGGLIHINLTRQSDSFANNTWVTNGLYQGKVYVFGMSVVANF